MPMFIITGSRITAAIWPSLSASASSAASASLNGTTITVSQSACGMPLEVGSVEYHFWSPVPPVWNRMSRTSASGTTENSTESWWPWYEPSILMILSRPVAARATRIASIVASVPELTNRIWSSWKRSQIASASATVTSVLTAKCVPDDAAFVIASTIFGWACPTTLTPNPLWKSKYSLPSTSHAREPAPRSR